MMKQLIRSGLLVLAVLLLPLSLSAQEGGIRGTVINRVTKEPVKNAKVVLVSVSGDRFVYTGTDGVFLFPDLADGVYRVLVQAADFQDTELNVKVEGAVKDLMRVSLAPDLLTGMADDAFLEFDSENEAGYEDIPSVLASTKDVYENIAGYKFSAARFLNRGYESGTADVYLNGIRFNDALTGYTPWSLWSGLNEATREKEIVTGLAASDYGVGGINGLTNINAYASSVRKGYRFSVLTSSGQYRLRLMATYSSGLMDNGWAYAFSVSTRQGGNDYVDGVFYNSWAYYAGVEKRFGDAHRLALTLFGSPTVRGAQGASTQEVYDLLDNPYYNPNWGYQNGKIRNSRVRNNHEPVAVLNYEFTPGHDTKLALGLSYRMGRNGYSRLDWYDAPDPRPDYYRNLPSYYDDDPWKAAWVREGWLTDDRIRHVNWDRMYEVNANSYFSGDETYSLPVSSTTRRSKYVVEEARTDQDDVNANLTFSHRFGSVFRLGAGYAFRWNRTEYYKVIQDLLGGDYWLDVDQFAERDFGTGGDLNQNDLNHPNRLVKEGDKYGYDYFAHVRTHRGWATGNLVLGRFEAVLGAEAGYQTFWREGLYRKGLFPDNSFGESERKGFFTYTGKLGLNYKFEGQQMVYANIGVAEQAPYFQESFLSPRTRNSFVPHLTTEKIFSADLNYSLKIGEFALRATAFYTTVRDQTDLISFYDDIQRAYTNFAMSGIDQRNMGMELGVKVPLTAGFSLQGALSYGEYIYTSTPFVTQTIDNSDKIVLQDAKVYWEGYKVPSTPQLAANLGLHFRSRNYLFASLDVSYFDGMYLSMNPLRRTDYANAGFDLDTPEGYAQMRAMTDQERLTPGFIVNANFGKSWYIQRKYNLGVSVDIKNLLNNTGFRTGGYEQMRLSANRDAAGNVLNYTAFDSKYFYMFGLTYMVNLYFRF